MIDQTLAAFVVRLRPTLHLRQSLTALREAEWSGDSELEQKRLVVAVAIENELKRRKKS